jgi:hypothetical protein
MKRKRVVVGLVVLSLVAVTAVLLWPVPPRPGLQTFRKVREGMTLAEVIRIVGAPPDRFMHERGGPPPEPGLPMRTAFWDSAEGNLNVILDADDRAVMVTRGEYGIRPTPLQRLRARLGL